jgi:transcriptional regulator with XRE-family HTH domain
MEQQQINTVFPVRLKRLRERHRISRKVLSECCGMSKNVISQYERGDREPTASSLAQIADFFEVSTDYLLGRQNFL